MATQYQEISDESLMPLPADRLIEGIAVPCDIFIRDKGSVVSLFNRGIMYDGAAGSLLKQKNISEIFIRERDADEFSRYMSRGRQAKSAPEAVAFRDYSDFKESHYQIDRALLGPGSEISFSIYLLNRLSFTPLIEASESGPRRLDEGTLSAAGDFVIKTSDVPLYLNYINALLTPSAAAGADRAKIRSVAIRENSKLVMKDLLDDPRSGEKIKESIAMVNRMVDDILENRDAIYDLLSLRTYDYYTYTHSVNVATLSVGLGIATGMSRDDLEDLGIGSMLHDLGKSRVPREILNKQGKLDDAEFGIMKTHVVESEKILRIQKDIPEQAFTALLQHHEKLNGRGYPFGLSGKDIKAFGRITAIADCYDAITTQRPYKPAFTPFHALSIITGETGNYDPDLLAVFIKMLGKIT